MNTENAIFSAAELLTVATHAKASYTEAAEKAYDKAKAAQAAFENLNRSLRALNKATRHLEKRRRMLNISIKCQYNDSDNYAAAAKLAEDGFIRAKERVEFCQAYYSCAVHACVEANVAMQRAFMATDY